MADRPILKLKKPRTTPPLSSTSLKGSRLPSTESVEETSKENKEEKESKKDPKEMDPT